MEDKPFQRRKAYDARNAQVEKERLSQIICNKFVAQVAYTKALAVMWYIHCRSEVRTLKVLTSELSGNKKIVIPYCTTDSEGHNKLGLWWLKDVSELIPGTWGILEPPKDRWDEPSKLILPVELDLIMVPGVAFDRQGGRLGNGAGYYDRLFKQVRPDTQLTAVCYESQLLEKVVMEKHDIYMDAVLTEKNNYLPKVYGLECS